MSEENVDARPLTSVALLDAAVWREIDSEEAQPQAAFLERYRAWLDGGSWRVPMPREWML